MNKRVINAFSIYRPSRYQPTVVALALDEKHPGVKVVQIYEIKTNGTKK